MTPFFTHFISKFFKWKQKKRRNINGQDKKNWNCKIRKENSDWISEQVCAAYKYKCVRNANAWFLQFGWRISISTAQAAWLELLCTEIAHRKPLLFKWQHNISYIYYSKYGRDLMSVSITEIKDHSHICNQFTTQWSEVKWLAQVNWNFFEPWFLRKDFAKINLYEWVRNQLEGCQVEFQSIFSIKRYWLNQ